jgi:hypothetical protein
MAARIAFACCLACCLVAACGRLGFDDEASSPQQTIQLGSPARPPVRCLSSTLASFNLSATNQPSPPNDLTATATPFGAAVFWSSLNDGLWGLTMNAAGTASAPVGLRTTDHWINAISSTDLDDALIVSVSDSTNCVEYDRDDPNLVRTPLAHLPQIRPSRLPIGATPNQRVAATGFADGTGNGGVALTAFDASWTPAAAPMATFASALVQDVVSATYADAVFVAWSTATSCHFVTYSDAGTKTTRWDAVGCGSPRVAVSDRDLLLAYETSDGVLAVRGADAPMPAQSPIAAGKAPRVAYDGARYWLAYLDANGAIVAGYVDADGALQSAPLSIAPINGAYDLIVIDGAPWVIAANGVEYTADQLCVP